MTAFTRFGFPLSILMALVLAISCGKKNEAADDTADQDIKTSGLADPSDSLILEMTGIDSMTVLDILKREHDVSHMSSLKGAYVIRIDETANEGGYYWLYSVNGVMGEVACDKHVTGTGDVVRWHYRKTGTLQL